MAKNNVVGILSILTEISTDGLNRGIASASASLSKFGKAANDNVSGAMRGLSGQLGAVGSGMAALGPIGISAAAGIAVFGAALFKARESLNFIDALGDAATKLHINVEALQTWRFAAQEAGLEAGDFDEAIMGLQSSVGKMLTGIGAARVKKAFDALGLSKEQIASFKNVEDMLPLIADRLAEVGTVAERAAIADKMGIRGLLPLLDQGSAKIEQFTQKARDLGIVIDSETAASMGELQRSAEIASQAIDINLKQAFLGMAPLLVSFTQSLAGVAQYLSYITSLFQDVDQRTTAQLNTRKDQLEALIATASKAIGRGDLVAEYKRQNAEIDAILAKRAKTGDKGILPIGGPDAASGVAPTATKKAKAVNQAGLQWGQYATLQAIDETKAVDLTRPLMAKQFNQIPSLQNNIAEVMKAWDDKQEEIRAKFASSIRGGLEAGMKGGIPGVMEYIAQQLRNRLLDNLANGLANMFQSQGGGWFGKVVSIFAKVPTGGTTAVPGFASGTSYAPGGLALVGERGPELVNLPRGSSVRTAAQTAAMGQSRPIIFDMRGAVVTADLLAQMNAIGAQAAVIGATGGAAMARQNMSRSAWNRMA